MPLLNLPLKILEALREGKLDYTKTRTIARVKNEQQRDELLKQAIAQNFSLNEIKVRSKESNIDSNPETTPKQILVGRMTEITKRLKKSKTWNERKKQDRLTKLLDELEQLIGKA